MLVGSVEVEAVRWPGTGVEDLDGVREALAEDDTVWVWMKRAV